MGSKGCRHSFKNIFVKVFMDQSLKDKNNFHPWKGVATQLLSSVGGESVFHSNLKLLPQYSCNVKKLSSFYKGLYTPGKLCALTEKEISIIRR